MRARRFPSAFAALLSGLVLSACAHVQIAPNPCDALTARLGQEGGLKGLRADAQACRAAGGDVAQSYTLEAAGALDEGDAAGAIAAANAALARAENYATAYHYRASAHALLGDTARALADFDRAITLDIPPAYGVAARGRFYFSQGRYERAYQDFDAYVEAAPEDWQAYQLRGAGGAVLERLTDADRDFSRAIALNPKALKSFSGRAYVRYLLGRYAEAAADYRMALTEWADGLKIAFLYFSMLRAGDPRAGAELAERTAGIDVSRYPGVYPALLLGRISIAEALEIGERTGQHAHLENMTEAYFYAGMVELLAGRRAEAIDWFQRTLATGVRYYDETRAARKELRALGIDPGPSPALDPAPLRPAM